MPTTAHSSISYPPNYTFDAKIGAGAFSKVYKALSRTNGGVYAIKVISVDTISLLKDTLREIQLMHRLKHQRVMPLIQTMIQREGTTLNVYLVMPKYDTSLDYVIRSPQPLSEAHTKYFLRQILDGLEFMHFNLILHRDLKPANLLIMADCTIVIADMGASCAILTRTLPDVERSHALTYVVVTLTYRAPEIFLTNGAYSTPIDMWSVGCILYELYTRRRLFDCCDEMAQARKYVNILGAPTSDELCKISNRQTRCQFKAHTLTDSRNAGSLRGICRQLPHNAVHMLGRLVTWDPSARLSAKEALDHPFLLDPSDAITKELKGLAPPVAIPVGPPTLYHLNNLPTSDELLRLALIEPNVAMVA